MLAGVDDPMTYPDMLGRIPVQDSYGVMPISTVASPIELSVHLSGMSETAGYSSPWSETTSTESLPLGHGTISPGWRRESRTLHGNARELMGAREIFRHNITAVFTTMEIERCLK